MEATINVQELSLRIDAKKLQRAAYVLKAVAHPVRIAIIDILEQGGKMSVSTLQEILNIEQSLLSHHLTNLRDKGIVDCERNGKNIYYELVEPTISTIIGCINNCKAF